MATGPVRFLLIHADPTGKLWYAAKEVEDIKAKLEATWGTRLDVQTSRKEASGMWLNEVLREGKYHVIHFAGHAHFDRLHPELSGLLLHDHPEWRADGRAGSHVFFAQKVRCLLEGQPLVFLNACQSSWTANETPAQRASYLMERADGLATAFIYGGARACIGAQWPVYDGDAAEFAVQFYHHALNGVTIGEALRLARQEGRKKGLAQPPDKMTWAAHVLYGDPTCRLPRAED